MESETYAAEGGNVTIVCKPEAAPRPKFVWKKDGNVIGSGGRRRILETGNLIVSPVSRDDEGTYVCTATNQYGSDETRGRLIVLRKSMTRYFRYPYAFTRESFRVFLLFHYLISSNSCKVYLQRECDFFYL